VTLSPWMRGERSSPPRQPLIASASSVSATVVVRAKPLILTAADIFSAVRIGVLTGGGDCPGLNAVIRAVVRKGIDAHGHAIVGFRDGWRGPLENAYEELTIESTRGILPRGGTILRSSRTNPFKHDGGPEKIAENMRSLNLDGLIAIGGEDTLGAAARLHGEHGLPVLGVPKTIDNDLGGTDMTFGFDTAVQIATEAIDRLHTTAESHNRVMIVEVMGRHAGWIALYSGLAGGADVILIPERPFDIEEVVRLIRRRHSRGRFFSIVVVAEGSTPQEGTLEVIGGDRDEFGHERLGGIGQLLERELGKRTGFDTRATVLGHIQRGGTPTAFDRVLATRLGLAAIDAAHDRRWGVMPALLGTRIELVALSDAVTNLRLVPEEDYAAAAAFFG
jgi:ATP-dependent phosphofructokinase / diphosphate-dependent phosphofructokinase